MEDPDVECKIEEHLNSKKSNGKVSWILNKGLWLGKKILITGVVISSAPLVLPPLVVFTTLGFACSVPFGLVFTSYACTEKLMSKLLPVPASSFVLEYGTISSDENQKEEAEDLVDLKEKGQLGFGREVMIEQVEDTVEGVVMRVELEEKDGNEFQGDDILHPGAVYWQNGAEKHDQKRVEDASTVVVMRIGYDNKDSNKFEGGDLWQADVDFGQNSVQEEHEKCPLVEEEQLEATMEGAVMSIEFDGEDISEFEERDHLQYVVDYDQNCVENHEVKKMEEEEQMDFTRRGIVRRTEMDENDRNKVEEIDILQVGADYGQTGDENHMQKLREKEEHMNNTMDGVGKIIELNEKVRNELEGGLLQDDMDYGLNGVEKREEKPMEVIDEIVEEGGYEEDVGKYLEGEDECKPEETDAKNNVPMIEEDRYKESLVKMSHMIVIVGGDKQSVCTEGGKQHIRDFRESEKVVLVARRVAEETGGKKNVVDDEDEGLVRESTGLLEKIRNEGKDGHGMKESCELAKFEDRKNIEVVDEPVEELFEGKIVEMEKLVGVMKVTDIRERNSTISVEIGASMDKIDKPFEDKKLKLEKIIGEVKGIDTENNEVTISVENKCVEENGKPFEENNVKLEKCFGRVKETDASNRVGTFSGDYEGRREEIEKPIKPNIASLDKFGTEMKGTYVLRTDHIISEETEKPFKGDNLILGKMVTDMEGTNEKETGQRISKELKDMQVSKTDSPDVVEHFGEVGCMIEDSRDANNAPVSFVVENISGHSHGMVNKKNLRGLSQTILQEQKPVSEKEMVMQEGRLNNNVSNAQREDLVKWRKTTFIYLNSDLSEIADESGLDLVDGRTMDEYCYTGFDNPEENQIVTGSIADDNESHEFPISTGVPESNYTKLGSRPDPAMPSNEELLVEEKIWEKIDALRAIVGYKAAKQSSSIDELKALYVFTGVEPPPSSKELSDFAEVNEKLQFLMSIIGVK